MRVAPFAFRYQGNGATPCQYIDTTRKIYWYHSKGNWLRYNFAADGFYTMKLYSRLFVLYCWNCLKDDKFRYLITILRQLGRRRTLADGSLESPCRLLKCNWTTFFYLLPLRRYKTKRAKPHCFQERVGHFEPRFQGGRGRAWGIFFWFLQKKIHFAIWQCKQHGIMLWHNTGVWQTDGQTNGRTDGRNCRS